MHRPTLSPLILGLLLALAGVGGCGTDAQGPDGDPLDEASREAALEQTATVLEGERMLQTARRVDDLTGGFALGLAEEAGGLDMELGGELPQAPMQEWTLSASMRSARLSLRTLPLPQIHAAKSASDPQPGDILAEWTETRLDGSVTTIRIVQDEPLAVVRVERETVWPEDHLLLVSLFELLVIDRGEELAIGTDDLWLAFHSELVLVGGATLRREVDARAQGGLVDDLRVDVVSTFTPRPDHPRWIDTVTVLTVDLHDLESAADDRFVRVERITRLVGVSHDGQAPRVVEELEPSEPLAEGEEPCGGRLSRTLHFRVESPLERWTDLALWSCEGGGELGREILYADGSVDALGLRDEGDGIVWLEALARDGSETTGRFDEAAGSFELQTVHAAGSDPVRRSLTGALSEDRLGWSLDEEVLFQDAFVERNHLEGREDGDGVRLAGSHEGRDGRLEFTLTRSADETVCEGQLENERGEILDWRVERLPDGSALLDFVAESEGRRVEGHLEVDPDGCGVGTLVVEQDGDVATLTVEFCADELGEPDGRLARSR